MTWQVKRNDCSWWNAGNLQTRHSKPQPCHMWRPATPGCHCLCLPSGLPSPLSPSLSLSLSHTHTRAHTHTHTHTCTALSVTPRHPLDKWLSPIIFGDTARHLACYMPFANPELWPNHSHVWLLGQCACWWYNGTATHGPYCVLHHPLSSIHAAIVTELKKNKKTFVWNDM